MPPTSSPFAELAATATAVGATRSKNAKRDLLAAYLRGLPAGDLAAACAFFAGRPLADQAARLGMGWVQQGAALGRANEVGVSGETADTHPMVFTSITVEHRIGGAVDAEALRRSIEFSATRYCPVSAMLSAVATIEHKYLLTAKGTREATLVAVTGPGRFASPSPCPRPVTTRC